MPTDLLKEPETINVPTKRVTEKYTSEVTIEKNKRDPNLINCHIGNSGLQVRILYKSNPTEYIFDYYPNIKDDGFNKDNRAKKSSIFASALLSFRNWLNDPISQKEYDFNNNTITSLSNFTNPKMANYIRKLFSENSHPEMVNIDTEGVGTHISIDLKKFCKLPETDRLIQYLERLDDRTRNITLTYNKEIY